MFFQFLRLILYHILVIYIVLTTDLLLNATGRGGSGAEFALTHDYSLGRLCNFPADCCRRSSLPNKGG